LQPCHGGDNTTGRSYQPECDKNRSKIRLLFESCALQYMHGFFDRNKTIYGNSENIVIAETKMTEPQLKLM
jgi:hypothetical protein